MEEELAEELRFHLDQHTADLIARGCAPDEARRQATLALGGPEQVKEECRDTRGTRWLHDLQQDLHYALRNLRASPGFTLTALLSLALGIGANTAIFSLIDTLMLKYLPVSHPEELLQVGHGGEYFGWFFTNALWEALRDRQQVFSRVFAFGQVRFNLNQAGEARRVQGAWVSGEYFTTLGLRPALGRLLVPADDQSRCGAVAALSHGFWQSEFGGRGDVLGRNISLDGHPFEIVGVVQPGFSGLDVGVAADIMVPLCSERIIRGDRSWLDDRKPYWLRVVGRSRQGFDPRRVDAGLKVIGPQALAAAIPSDVGPDDLPSYSQGTFETLPAGNGLSSVRTQYSKALFALMSAVALVLLIACANVAALLLARAELRQHEIAIRMAIGAGRGRLIRQLLTESLLLSLGGAALGILFAHWSTRVLVVSSLNGAGTSVSINPAIDFRVLVFTIGIALATGLLFGIAPALWGTRVNPHAAMRANMCGIAKGRFGMGKALATFQVALSLVLVTAAGLMAGTLHNLASLDSGFNQDHVLLVKADLGNAHYSEERLFAKFEEIRERLTTIPGVLSASFSDVTPISGVLAWSTLEVEGFSSKSKEDATARNNSVSRQFFTSLGTPVLAGREFDEHDVKGAPLVAIVNETLARKFFRDAILIGRYFRADNVKSRQPIQVIGVVKDSKYLDLREQALPTFYTSIAQGQLFDVFNFSTNFEVRTAGPLEGMIPGIRAAIAEVSPGATFEFKTLALQVAESLNRERLLATLAGFFGLLGLVVASIGLYGVMSYRVARRRNEIGIRMALGADQGRILRMVLGEISIMIAAGVAAGIAGALMAARLLASFLYGVRPNDPYTLVVATVILSIVATVAGYLPARHAARVDPMAALRHE
jgi:predicted permease